jgi:hypothetical protein
MGTGPTFPLRGSAYTSGMEILDAPVESRLHLLARAMRTLVDLLHTEHGYARIFYDQEGYSYELHSYQLTPMADLFTRMLGYASVDDATAAARDTLTSIHSTPRGRSNKHRARGRRLRSPQVTQLILPVSVN